MKIQQKKRERILMFATIIVAVLALFYQLGFSSLYDSITETSEQLEAEKEKFEEYIEQYERKDQIEKAYKEIEGTFPPTDPNMKPEQQFIEDVANMAKKFGFLHPDFEPPKDETIENVNDYKFILLTVTVTGPLDNLSNLLIEFHRNALLIKELQLSAPLDRDSITATITAARIAKLSEEEIERLREKGKSRTSSRSLRRLRY